MSVRNLMSSIFQMMQNFQVVGYRNSGQSDNLAAATIGQYGGGYQTAALMQAQYGRNQNYVNQINGYSHVCVV